MKKALYIAIIALLATGCSKKEHMALETHTISHGDIVETVTATGTLESVTQVDVGTQVTGIIAKLYADYNTQVKAGQLIAEIDKTTLDAELRSANANLESARTTYEYSKRNYDRDRQLHDKQLISDYEFETTRKEYQVAKAAYDKAQADRVRAAKNLSYAEIYSPIDGIVISREVEVGQTVVSSMNVANLFTIADLSNMRVVADVDEADIGSVKVGMSASFTVDAFPNDVFEGQVTQVRLKPTTTSNVVTYEVLINAPNPELKLIPGLTANITINVKEARNVLTVPLKALRFEPQSFADNEGLPPYDSVPTPPASASRPEKPGDKPKDPAIPTTDMHRLVWALRDGRLVPVEIELGVDNGVDAQVISGLVEGDKVAIAYESASDAEAEEQQAGGLFGPPRRDKKKKGSDSSKK